MTPRQVERNAKPIQITGTVNVSARGAPAGVRVRIEAVLPEGGTVLATVPLDPDGGYHIAYRPECGRTGQPMPVRVRVVDVDGTELARGPVLLDAAEELRCDLDVPPPAGPGTPETEYERVRCAVGEVLGERAGAALPNAPGERLAVLERAVGEPAQHLLAYGWAHRLAASSGVDPELLYGLLRADPLRAGHRGVLSGDSASRRAALAQLGAAGVIGIDVVDRLAAAEPRLYRAAARLVLDGGEPGADHLADLLRAVVPDAALREPVLAAVLARLSRPVGVDTNDDAKPAAAIDGGTKPASGGENEAADLAGPALGDGLGEAVTRAVAAVELAMTVDRLAGGDDAVVAAVRRMHAAGEITVARELAGWSAADWAALLGDRSPARGRALATAWAGEYPSAAVIQRAQRRPDSPLHQPGLLAFFAAHPDLDLAQTDLARMLAGGGTPPPGPVPHGHPGKATPDGAATAADPDPRRTLDELLRLQRLFSVTADPDQLDTLLRAGYRSATAIARRGRAQFVREQADHVGGAAAADLLYDRADLLSAAATAIVLAHGQAFDSGTPAVLAGQRAAVDVPGWEELFGDPAAGTECPPARSVLSPSAYLVDLLAFVGRLPAEPGTNPLTVLLTRRPDLGRLLLSEANSGIEVPLIDQATELLECFVLDPRPATPVAPRIWLDDDLPLGTVASPGWSWATVPAPRSGTRCLSSAPEWACYTWPASAATPIATDEALFLQVWLDPVAPPTGLMAQWLARRDGQDRWRSAQWGTGLPSIIPTVGSLPATGGWVRLELTAQQLGLEGSAVHGLALGVAGGRAAFDLIGVGPRSASTPPRPPVATSGTAQERLAEPQQVLAAAYQTAASAVHPWTLPFDLGAAHARAMLSLLGLDRLDLLDAVHPGTGADRQADPALAAPRLDLTEPERRLLAGDSLGADEAAHWGYDSAAQPGWFQDLLHAPQFLRRTGLSYQEMRTAPGAAVCPGLGVATDPATPAAVPLVTGLSPVALPRLRRFLRLWRLLGWSAGEVERVLVALTAATGGGPVDVTAPLLHAVAQVRAAAGRLGLSPTTVANLMAPRLDTSRYGDPLVYDQTGPGSAAACPYERVFRHDPGCAAVFVLDATRTELATVQPLDRVLPYVLSALRTNMPDLSQIVAQAFFPGQAPDPVQFTQVLANVENLSLLWRQVTLARALRLPLTDLHALIELRGDPFDARYPERLWLLAEVRDRARATGFPTAELAWLLRPTGTAAPRSVPDRAKVIAALADVRERLRRVAADHPALADPDPSVLATELAAVGCANADSIVSVLTDAITATAPLPRWPAGLVLSKRLAGWIRYLPASGSLTAAGNLSTDDRDALLAACPEPDWQQAVTALWQQPRDILAALAGLPDVSGEVDPATPLLDEGREVTGRLRWLGERLIPYARRVAGTDTVLESLGAAMDVDPERLALIFSALTVPGSVSGEPGMSAVLDMSALDDEADIDPAGPAVEVAQRAWKIAWLAARLRLDAEELRFMLFSGGWCGWLDPQVLPVTGADAAPAPTTWDRLLDHVWLRDACGAAGADLVACYERAAVPAEDPADGRAAALADLAAVTGRSVDVLTALAAPDRLDLHHPEDFTDERGAVRLLRVLRMADRAGVAAPTLVDWARHAEDTALAGGIERAARGRYDASSWPDAVRATSDTLRRRRRDALVSVVVAAPQRYGLAAGTRAAELSDRLLCDVQVDTGRATPRVAAAIGTVQRFVQRCQLGLESGVSLSDVDNAAWQGMRRYSTWRQGRSVLVYPESWLDPELRRGKTPLFQAMEAELLEGELTADSVERAYLHYLQGLEAIGRLEISALHRQREVTAAGRPVLDTLHVIGRTKASPHLYYYRSLDLDLMVWTPWQRVEVDIDGEHVTLATVNRRLFLFWPQLTTRGDDPPATSLKDPALPQKRREVRLAWTDRRQNRWSPKQVSRPDVWVPESIPLEMLSLRSSATGGELRLDLEEYLGWDAQLGGYTYLDRSRGKFRLPGNDVGRVIGTTIPAGTYAPSALWMPGDTVMWYQFYAGDPSRAPDPAHMPLKLMLAPGDHTRAVVLSSLGPHTVLYPSREYGSWTFDSYDPFVLQLPERGFLVLPQLAPQPRAAASVPLAPVDALPAAADGADPKKLPAIPLSVPAAPAQPAPAALDQPASAVRLLIADRSLAYPPVDAYQFSLLYHPYVRLLLRELDRGGLPAVLRRDLQLAPATFLSPDQVLDFAAYGPQSDLIAEPAPAEDLDFAPDGACAIYNWELFCHAPLLIARRLTREQRFDEARTWLHYVFNPTDTTGSAPQRFWQVRPLYQAAGDKPLDELLRALSGGTDPQTQAMRDALLRQIERWRRDPLDPDAVASLRLSAYQKAVVFAYLDNLIAWGDTLMADGDPERIDEAAQLYALADQLLGPAPLRRTRATGTPDRAFDDLRPHLDEFADAVVQVEQHLVSWRTDAAGGPGYPVVSTATMLTPTLYFGVEANDRLLGYWELVADRLDKVRRGLSLEGEPLAAGGAAGAGGPGAGGGGVGAAVVQRAPRHRFTALLQKAQDVCAEVRGLGGALLAALEKRDAERLALLRSTHELRLLDAVRDVKRWQVDEAVRAVESAQRTRELAVARAAYYGSRPYLNPREEAHLRHQQSAAALQSAAQQVDVLGAELALIPQFDVGAEGMSSPVVKAAFGGQQLSGVTQVFSRVLSTAAAAESHQATMAAVLGSYDRRRDDWRFQAQLAAKEIQQADAQIAAAGIRRQVAEREFANHDVQVEQALAVDEYLRGKFTNDELYGWMIGRLSGLYYTGYRLAADLARRAEQALRFELADPVATFVSAGHWDSQHRGLLAGEQLAAELRRMDLAYLDRGHRDLELTKHVSLLRTDPAALVRLRGSGACFIDIPEALFDLDYPGHYLRRLAGVAISVPCVTGPYQGVNCRVTLVGSVTRVSAGLDDGYPRVGPEDARFVEHLPAVRSIVTSSGVNDTGLFEPGRAERFLPFEGAGATSRWYVEIPLDDNAIDPTTISDVVLHLRYTARNGGASLRAAASAWLAQTTRGRGTRLVQATRDCPDSWRAFTTAAGGGTHELRLPIAVDDGPTAAPPQYAVTGLDIVLVAAQPQDVATLDAVLQPGDGPPIPVPVRAVLGGMPYLSLELEQPATPGTWSLTVDQAQWNQAWAGLDLRELFVVWRFGPLG